MSGNSHRGSPRWTHPLAPWPSDRQRWEGFCRSIDARIRQVRQAEGISSRRGDVWQTFAAQTPAPAPLPPRPIQPPPPARRMTRLDRAAIDGVAALVAAGSLRF